jgi:SAM-dependent methyltransferase
MTAPARSRTRSLESARRSVRVAIPDPTTRLEQDEEWFLVERDGRWEEVRVHDYERLYSIPGLYERVVYDVFCCRSPWVVRDLLLGELERAGVRTSDLTVLDLGAGNGYVAEVLREIGVERFVGMDIIPQAAEAAERDRPGLYQQYVVGDVTDLPTEDEAALRAASINCLTCVAALGFGDVPPEAFVAAFNKVQDGGWIAITIKADFLTSADETGFSALMRRLIRDGIVDLLAKKPFVHRCSTSGDPIEYVALVGRKCSDATA